VSDAPRDPAEVEAQGFPHKPFLRLGYDRGAVDEFVTLVALAIHNERQTTVSADDVARTRFPSRRLGRGYRMREVDDYLGAAEALLRTRAANGVGTRAATGGPHGHHHQHHPTWWIYGVAAVLVVAIVVFTLLQT
jgi:DivIVA domain-containing protein